MFLVPLPQIHPRRLTTDLGHDATRERAGLAPEGVIAGLERREFDRRRLKRGKRGPEDHDNNVSETHSWP
jgi:hypothetical protein